MSKMIVSNVSNFFPVLMPFSAHSLLWNASNASFIDNHLVGDRFLNVVQIILLFDSKIADREILCKKHRLPY